MPFKGSIETLAGRIPGLSYDVGATGTRGIYSTGQYTAGKIETMLDRSGLKMYAVPPEANWGASTVAADATRRLATVGDKQFSTAGDALAEALTRHGIDPSTVEITTMYGKNQNLLGPQGQPWESVRGLNLDGELIQFEHHANGHFFGDANEFELPHYHGPNGEHLTY